MKQFIKLTSKIINKSHIVEISIVPGKYFVYMNDKMITGSFILSNGSISTDYNMFEICENKNKQDFETITKFINEIE